MSKSEKTPHPGKVLKEKFLIPKSISISEFSNKTGITKRRKTNDRNIGRVER